MKYINTYNNLAAHDADTNRAIENTVSYIKDIGDIIYNPYLTVIPFQDPEVISILETKAGLVYDNGFKRSEIEAITSLGNWFHESNIVSFNELKYFTGITSMSETFFYCFSLTEAIIPASVTSMQSTFFGCINLIKTPIIPASVTFMYGTFESCTSLIEAPIIPAGITDMSDIFKGCSSLTEAIIPNGVTRMENTFAYCSSLIEAPIIPDSVTDMGGTFAYCSSLIEAPIIPDSVTYMGGTFEDCTSLIEAPIIPASVTNMGGTFLGCTNINGIYIINSITPPYYSEYFNSFSNVVSIYVPDASVATYKAASGWIEYADKIKPMSTK